MDPATIAALSSALGPAASAMGGGGGGETESTTNNNIISKGPRLNYHPTINITVKSDKAAADSVSDLIDSAGAATVGAPPPAVQEAAAPSLTWIWIVLGAIAAIVILALLVRPG